MHYYRELGERIVSVRKKKVLTNMDNWKGGIDGGYLHDGVDECQRDEWLAFFFHGKA